MCAGLPGEGEEGSSPASVSNPGVGVCGKFMGLSVLVSEPVYTHSPLVSKSRPSDCDGTLENYDKVQRRLIIDFSELGTWVS